MHTTSDRIDVNQKKENKRSIFNKASIVEVRLDRVHVYFDFDSLILDDMQAEDQFDVVHYISVRFKFRLINYRSV